MWKIDLFFISDGGSMDPGDHPSFVNRFEQTLLSARSRVTTHIGLGGTVSTNAENGFAVVLARGWTMSIPNLWQDREQQVTTLAV